MTRNRDDEQNILASLDPPVQLYIELPGMQPASVRSIIDGFTAGRSALIRLSSSSSISL